LTLAEFGAVYLGGKTAKTAKRRVLQDRIPYYRDHGHILIQETDAEAWREARRIQTEEPNLKSMVVAISKRVLAARQQRAS
jgi:hypothetical protein